MNLQNGYSIRSRHKGTEVTLDVDVDVSGNRWTLHFSYGAGHPFNAQLLANALDKALDEKITQVREYEYNRGWKDAKAKRVKSTFHSCTLHVPSE